MKPAALTLVLALSLSASAFAQQEARNEREYRDIYSELTVGIQNTFPGGDAFTDTRWSDLMSGGIGLNLEYSHLWRESSWIYCGYFASLQIDSFGGRRATLAGVEVRTDRTNQAAFLVGGRIRENFNGFHMDQSAGIGASIYMGQELDVLNGGPEDVELIKSSVNYAAQLSARIGAPLGKNVDLNLGIGLRFNGAPEEGKDVTGIKFKAQQNFVIGLSLDFGF